MTNIFPGTLAANELTTIFYRANTLIGKPFQQEKHCEISASGMLQFHDKATQTRGICFVDASSSLLNSKLEKQTACQL
jgi:hypothetical protein